jgi:hypothetical protein
MTLKVLALNCSLKREGESSSTDRLLKEVLDALGSHDAEGEIVRVVRRQTRAMATSGPAFSVRF